MKVPSPCQSRELPNKLTRSRVCYIGRLGSTRIRPARSQTLSYLESNFIQCRIVRGASSRYSAAFPGVRSLALTRKLEWTLTNIGQADTGAPWALSRDHLNPQELDFHQPETAERLWDVFYQRLRLAVRERVRDIRRPVASESEVALSAMNSFLNRAKEGQFQNLADDIELWKLLKTIAIRKANDLRKNLRAKKRGGAAAIYGQADQSNKGDEASISKAGVDAATDELHAPELESELSDLFSQLLGQLPDDRHRDVILLKLQGASVAMIAEHLETSTRTVQRMIQKMESEWQADFLQ